MLNHSKHLHPHPNLSRTTLCRNATNHLDVMLSESEASALPTGYEKADSSAVPQNDILTESLKAEGTGGQRVNRTTGVRHGFDRDVC